MGRVTRNKRIGAIFLVAAVLGVAPATEAKPRKAPKTTRTETRDYAVSAGGQHPGGGVYVCGGEISCLTLAVEPGEEYVTVEVADAGGMAAPFSVAVNGGPTLYCGETPEPLWLNGATEIEVSIYTAAVDCEGIATTGSFSATFSNRR